MTSRIVGLIPARAGSKRVPNKNVLRLHGHPLLAYTISAALDSGVFEKVKYLEISASAIPLSAA